MENANLVEKSLICTACPIGCRLSVKIEGKEVISVEGNTCKRGESYAKDECIAPKRTLTTTASAVIDGYKRPAAVKTHKPIPKELIFEAMEEINKITITEKLRIGSVVIENILNTGSDVILTQNV